MSQDKIRLLEHLIYSQFGDAIGEIASILLTRGSLSFIHIQRLSSLPPKTIHASLAILSLHSLIYHSDPTGEIELFEMNERAIEERMRIGKYSNLAGKWLGSLIPPTRGLDDDEDQYKEEGEGGRRGDKRLDGLRNGRAMNLVIKRLMIEGFVGEEEMIEVLGRELRDCGFKIPLSGNKNGKKSKGKGKVVKDELQDDDDDAAYNQLSKVILQKALKSNIISIITAGSQLSPSSLEIKWLASLRMKIKGAPTTKDINEMKMEVVDLKKQFAEEERLLAAGLEIPEKGDGNGGPAKKKFRPNAFRAEEGDENNGTSLPKGAFYRINSEKLHIRWRNELMCEFVSDRYNPIIAKVFGIILDIAEPEIDTLEVRNSNPISSHEIYARVKSCSPSIDLSETYAPAPKATKDFPATLWKLSKDDASILHEICNDLADRRDNEPPLEAPLGLSKEFLSAVGNGGPGGMKWRVEFGNCGARMKRVLVEAMVLDKVGKVGVRCWRIIEGKGKIDEKHLATLALLPVKEAREILGHLSSNSLIECQEVPRSADRAPSRTFFLWYVNYPKVIQTLLDHQFKALANLQAQRSYQLSQRSGLVAKRERSDVKDKEELLTFREREALEELDRILEALATAEQRIDRDIFVLRDMDKDV